MERGIRVKSVYPDSIAEELGVQPGDRLVAINGQPVRDILDYRYLVADEQLEVLVRKQDGEQWLLDIEKEPGEDLGLEPEGLGKIWQCANKCLFCFVDQMPRGMRDSLYVKDDDYRHSFLHGNFITLTNVTQAQLERIVALRLSPLYISVHTTNPRLRVKLLGNERAAKIREQLQFLAEHNIVMHTQVVMCPGLNDGRELERTIDDLAELWPQVQSLAVVPVGLTDHRRGLPEIQAVDAVLAAATIDLVESRQQFFLQRLGSRFVYAADEFYLKCSREIPLSEAYEDFPQVENGVGLVRLFLDGWQRLMARDLVQQSDTRVFVGTGRSAAPVIRGLLVDLVNKFPDARVKVVAIDNYFFGGRVTVAGLLTGRDVIRNVMQKLTPAERKEGILLLPDVMFKEGTNVFLDDLSVDQVSQELGMEIKVLDTSPEALLQGLGFAAR
ncbi:MAG: DUF512 domain-containing protein [Thermoanaerobacteraceae bacterium]|nr:DUF512 domain-containing protein [Thermoanaerobacteraceae bacterium]